MAPAWGTGTMVLANPWYGNHGLSAARGTGTTVLVRGWHRNGVLETLVLVPRKARISIFGSGQNGFWRGLPASPRVSSKVVEFVRKHCPLLSLMLDIPESKMWRTSLAQRVWQAFPSWEQAALSRSKFHSVRVALGMPENYLPKNTTTKNKHGYPCLINGCLAASQFPETTHSTVLLRVCCRVWLHLLLPLRAA